MKAGLCLQMLTLVLFNSVVAKNIVDISMEKDESGRLQRRLANQDPDVVAKEGKALLRADSYLQKRERDNGSPSFLDNLFVGVEGHAGVPNIMPVDLDSVLPLLREVNIYASYARNDVELSEMFADDSVEMIIFAPTNKAISSLTCKPWEFPQDIESLESQGAPAEIIDSVTHDNIVDFVRSHIVLCDESTHFFQTLKPGLTLLKSVAYKGPFGDILLKRDAYGDYFVASIKDETFYKVQKLEQCRNGVVLVVDTTLSWP